MNMQEKILYLVPEKLRPHAQETFEKYSINTVNRSLHFLSQVMHESGDFKRKEENLNYSANGLVLTFRKYFDADLAKQYQNKPEKIANRVYANRMGNGDEASGDGWKYRGRGFIQLTGKDNYEALSRDLMGDFVNNPHFVAEDKYAMLSAGWFWNSRNLNSLADLGLTIDVIERITKKVNGGLNGLSARIEKLNALSAKIKF